MQRERQVLSSPEVSEAHWNLGKGIDLLLSFDTPLYLFVWVHVLCAAAQPLLLPSRSSLVKASGYLKQHT